MKFFVPHVAEGEEMLVYNTIRAAVSEGISKLDHRKVFRVDFHHNGRHMHAQVGEVCPICEEPVYAILHQPKEGLYLVCTTSRGAQIGSPIVVHEKDVISYEDFR